MVLRLTLLLSVVHLLPGNIANIGMEGGATPVIHLPGLGAEWKRGWILGVSRGLADAAYLGDKCDNTADCLVPHSVCQPAGNQAWRQQMFCVCRVEYHPLTGYCEKDRDWAGDPEEPKNATTPAPTSPSPSKGLRLRPVESSTPRPFRPFRGRPKDPPPSLLQAAAELEVPMKEAQGPAIPENTQRLISQVVATLAEASRRQPTMVDSHIGSSYSGRLPKIQYTQPARHDEPRPFYYSEDEAEAPTTQPPALLQKALATISKDEMKSLIQEAAEAAIRKYLANFLPNSPETTSPQLPYFLPEETVMPNEPSTPYPDLFTGRVTQTTIPRIIYRGQN